MGEAKNIYFTCSNIQAFLCKPVQQTATTSTIKMSKASPPELKKFMDKRLGLQINGGRHLIGTLRGYDPFMNLVIDECVEKMKNGEMRQVGMVVIRGNSIIMLEGLDRI